MTELFDPVGDDCYDDEPPTITAPNEVDALQDAGWHLRQIRHLRERLFEADCLADAEQERIEAWRLSETDRIKAKIAWHETPLRQLSERLNELDPTRKTIRLPDGEMKLRVYSKPQVQIEDRDALLAWAELNAPQIVTTTHRVKVSDLSRETVAYEDGKVTLISTGEVVPYVSAGVPEPTWSCSTEVDES